MIITNEFVFIHVNKNGGSFITKCLQKIYTPNFIEKFYTKKMFINYKGKGLGLKNSIHNPISSIPPKYEYLPKLSCFRSPQSRLFSWYLYSTSKKRSNSKYSNVVLDPINNFESLNFDDFLERSNKSFKKVIGAIYPNFDDLNCGICTWQFLYMHHPNITNILKRKITPSELDQYLKEAKNYFTFLNHNQLNNDLFNYLKLLGHKEKKIYNRFS